MRKPKKNKELFLLSLLLTDWYFLWIDSGESLLEFVEAPTEQPAPVSDRGELAGEIGEYVLGGCEERGELFQRGGERAVRDHLHLGADRPAIRGISTLRHVSTAHVTRLYLPHNERHYYPFFSHYRST